jgi:molecular chaperone DnaJ
MARDYYWILGIEPDASQRQIQIAYQTKVRQLEAGLHQKAPMLDVQEAYSILGNPSPRRTYDSWPHKIPVQSQTTAGGRPPAEPLIPRETSGEPVDVSVTRSFRTASPSFDEIHDRLWSNFQDTDPPKSETIESLTLEVPLTPQQAFSGGRVRVLVPARAACPTCDGRGGVGPFVCFRCDGSGALIVEYPIMVAYPPGITDYAVQIPLERFGIHNFYLTVLFRVTHDVIE